VSSYYVCEKTKQAEEIFIEVVQIFHSERAGHLNAIAYHKTLEFYLTNGKDKAIEIIKQEYERRVSDEN